MLVGFVIIYLSAFFIYKGLSMVLLYYSITKDSK
jgi:hypothetical protein